MFRLVVDIIRFYQSNHLRLFYTIRVAACLMRRSEHQNPCWSIVPLYVDVEISSLYMPPRELYRIILSESNDKI